MTEFRCEACGFDNTRLTNEELVELIATGAATFLAALDAPLDELRRRPFAEVWSVLEYAVHQREVIAFYGARIEAIARTDDPQLTEYGFGEAADRDRYNDQDPAAVAVQISVATKAIARRLASLASDEWARAGRASTVGGGRRDIRNCASRLAHEFVHHGLDIENGGTTGRP